MSKIYKSPVELANSSSVPTDTYDPFDELPTSKTPLTHYDKAVDAWLNGFDPVIFEEEGIAPSDFGQGFIDDAENSYHNAPIGYQLPQEHYDYIRNKVNELIDSKYGYLKPFHKKAI